MSTGERVKQEVAAQVANTFATLLAPYCERIEVAGSLRRGKPDVGDLDMVIIARSTLLSFLDDLLAQNVIQRALYDGKPRWGEKQRGLVYQNITVEIKLTEPEAWGYALWLKTGPGDANTYVMKYCAWKKAPYRARDGYWWLNDERLAVPDEQTLFALLGMPYLEPAQRSVEEYRKHLESPAHRWGQIRRKQNALWSAEKMAELELIKLTPGYQYSVEPWDWQPPWLLKNGQVIIRDPRNHYRSWVLAVPEHPAAEQYRLTLERGWMFRGMEANELMVFLRSAWRQYQIDQVIQEAVEILREERLCSTI